MRTILVLAFLLGGFVFTANGQHEYAPLQEQKIKYKDWTYTNVRTNEDLNLREYAKDKKLVMVFYFAAWCHSSKYQSPITQKLYDKYKDQGLGIIGVSLYSRIGAVQKELENKTLTFPVVSESTSKFDRKESMHYKYRISTGDNRKWGTPWNIFLVPSKIKENGDVLVKKAFVANGELIEAEAEKYIREQLGLPPEEIKKDENQASKNEVIETCEETVDFKEPL